MANLKSAQKEIRKTKTRTVRNLNIKRKMKALKKEIIELAEAGKQKEAQEKFVLVTKQIDKAAKRNIIHKNAASRYKSRLAKLVNKTKEAKK